MSRFRLALIITVAAIVLFLFLTREATGLLSDSVPEKATTSMTTDERGTAESGPRTDEPPQDPSAAIARKIEGRTDEPDEASDRAALANEYTLGTEAAVDPEAGATLFGTVTFQDNRPAAGVDVSLTLTSLPDSQSSLFRQRWNGETPQRREMQTDGEGRFRFTDIDPGLYQLFASTQDFTTLDGRGNQVILEIGQEPTAEGPYHLVLSEAMSVSFEIRNGKDDSPIPGALILAVEIPGQRVSCDEDGRAMLYFPKIICEFQASADGFVPSSKIIDLGGDNPSPVIMKMDPGGTISGLVTDQDGVPLEEVTISMGFGNQLAQTDPDGRFKIEGLPLAETILTLTKKGYWLLATDSINLLPEVPERELALVLHSNETRSRPVEVRGLVRDENGQALKGATVGAPFVGEAGRSVTDARGRFTLAGNIGEQQKYVYLEVDAAGYFRQTVQVKYASISDLVEVFLEPGSWLAGSLVDMNDRPVVNALMGIARTSHDSLRVETYYHCGKDGTFRMEALNPENRVVLWSPNHAPVILDKSHFNQENLLVRLKEWGIVQGNVYHAENGQPISNFTIRVFSDKGFRLWPLLSGIPPSWSDEGVTFSSATGAFHLDGLATDYPVSLVLRANGFETSIMNAVVVETRDTAPYIEWNLKPARETVTGQVVNNQNQPRAGVQVWLQKFDNTAPMNFPRGTSLDSMEVAMMASNPLVDSMITGADGRFEFSWGSKEQVIGLFFSGPAIPDYKHWASRLGHQELIIQIPDPADLILTFSPPLPPDKMITISFKKESRALPAMANMYFVAGGGDQRTLHKIFPGKSKMSIRTSARDSKIMFEREVDLPEGQVTSMTLDLSSKD